MTDHPIYPDLAGASVFITGGGSGIGAALTEGFLQQGARAAFVQRSDASAFCDQMKEKTGTAPLFLPTDITDLDALRAALDAAAEAHGPVRVLVNNAADDSRHDTLGIDEAFWDASMAINLKPYFFAAQKVIPGMQAAGGGAIVNMSSISYMMATHGYAPYITANAAITGLTRTLAREFGPDGIRVNALLPGMVVTQRQLDKWLTPEGMEQHLERQCLKRTLGPEDMVGGTLFLASNASAAMTAQALVLDGGVVTTG
ncbi:NAD(P)-dependent dehydrogenase (short-subunit alcohol dehydrogenase family) [Aliiruegeria haliotis]|uniref:NAD(P)-dependent dehydrogenase (Short-subunit alcohol dehydrogenase family) n=1 Tax=Aliiruegeria haliotis TaxID=1280846 RepID=A0A2T0RNA0_9RHOB|nr:SDR family oxidoreductase [Aliiruegeria haliotis]PRY22602.1 NAD(P)-dependent dehydrogenase (short-subunit alcohol dehydrogenase family) [Aliiruegeria haliotis]